MTDLIDKIERLSAAATPGGWITAPEHMGEQDYETCIELPGKAGQIGAAIAYFHHDWETDRISWKAAQSNTALCVTLCNAVPEILTALRAQQHAEALATALSDASEELEYFVDFARRQCEFEGDDEAGTAVVRNARAALAAYRSVK